MDTEATIFATSLPVDHNMAYHRYRRESKMVCRASLIPTAIALLGVFGAACRAETIRIGYIDPFSGPAAGINETASHSLKMIVDLANKEGWAGANTFEVVDFDGKGSAQESVQQLKTGIDQGIRFFIQGLSSSVGLALVDAIDHYNERNPGKEVLYFSPTNQAPEFENNKCSFWSFLFDANTDIRTEALVKFLAKDTSIKKIYLINMNYAMGQQVSARAKAALNTLRPDIEIVGDDLHPMFQVKDFAPYISKIKASGADTVVTANWSVDLTLLLKAAKDANLKIPFYTFNATTKGIPTALAAADIDNVKVITYFNPSDDQSIHKLLVAPFREKYDDQFFNLTFYNLIRMLSEAIKDAQSSDAVTVARTLEGMKIKGLTGDLEMSKADHEVQQPLFIANWTKADGKDVLYDLEKTGYGFKTEATLAPSETFLATTCDMKRPN
jgi:branched-chain amino acid transport system substrate-binding protein